MKSKVQEFPSYTIQSILFVLYNHFNFQKSFWRQERDQMQKAIFDRDEEIESLKKQLEKQKQQMNKALKLADEVMAYRPPPRVYAMFLEEQFLLFQLMMIVRNIDYEFKNA